MVSQKKHSKQKSPSPQEVNQLMMLFAQGRLLEADNLARLLTKRFPRDGLCWTTLGAVLKQRGRGIDALVAMRKAEALTPSVAEVHFNLGIILGDLGQLVEAEASYQRALQIRPDYAEAHNNLGRALMAMDRLDEAQTHFRSALRIKPDDAVALNNLGDTLFNLGQRTEAESCYRQALRFNPDYVEAYVSLGHTLLLLGRPEEAESNLRRALHVNPGFADAHGLLGFALADLGRRDEAEACYRHALQIDPDKPVVRSMLLFLLSYADVPPAEYLAEAHRYGVYVSGKVTAKFDHTPSVRLPERLRIGLVSGDFNNHPVGFFLESILARFDSASVDLLAYPTGRFADDLTERIRPLFSAWKPIVSLGDEDAARMIHDDGVHVLIDLAGHTSDNRLPVFAWKPAPIQVSWLGYFASTGLAAMDYLIADPWTLLETQAAHFTEKIWRLPETRWCFSVPNVTIPVTPLPALDNGYVTFGCFNNLRKITDAVVALWARVLVSVPHSRLFLKTTQLGSPSVCNGILARFADCGIAADRLILEGASTREEYLATYNRVDIALDPFPYTGGTTSVEGLWMGVPVLTLSGESLLSRQGVGLLMNAGLPDWIGTDVDDYLARAVALSSDLLGLAALRGELRQKVLASPLFDAPRFAHHFEAAMWGMWQVLGK